jgi:hypothetical protein
MKKEACITVYENNTEKGPGEGLRAVQKYLVAAAAKQAANKKRTAKGEFWRAQEIFASFTRWLLEEKKVYVSRYDLVSYMWLHEPFIYSALKALGFQPIRDYERWSRQGS